MLWGDSLKATRYYRQVIDEIRQEVYTVGTVSAAAQKIHGIASVPVKIIEICQNMGFSVFQQGLPKKVRGYVVVDGELKDRFGTDRVISVNMYESTKKTDTNSPLRALVSVFVYLLNSIGILRKKPPDLGFLSLIGKLLG